MLTRLDDRNRAPAAARRRPGEALTGQVSARLRAGTAWINAYRVLAPNMFFVELTSGTRDP